MPGFTGPSRAPAAVGALFLVLGAAGLLAFFFRSGPRAASAPQPDPEGAARHLRAASQWAMQSQFSAAVAEGRRALARDPGAPGAHRILGYAHYRLKRYPEARAALERAVAADPNDPFAACFLGLTYAEHPATETETRRAQQLLEAAVGRYQGAEAWYGLGLLALRDGRLEQAIRYLTKAVRTDPGWESGRYRLAEAYRRAGKMADAEREARVFEQLRETRPAYERLTARAAKTPEDDRLRLQLARFCFRTKRHREALEQFRALASRTPSPKVFRGLRAAAEAVGERELAARAGAALAEARHP